MKKFSLLIPTLGERTEYLNQLTLSLKGLEEIIQIIIICNVRNANKISKLVNRNIRDYRVVIDPGKGLAHALNYGLGEVQTEFWTWIGDDDLLDTAKYSRFLNFVSTQPENISLNTSIYQAGCSYISESGKVLARNYPKKFAKSLIFVGPNLFPQPSLIFRTDLSRNAGGLNENLNFAFDQELIMEMILRGTVLCYPEIVTYYRWHKETLTARNRAESIEESYQIRLRYSQTFFSRITNKLLFFPSLVIVKVSSLFFNLRAK